MKDPAALTIGSFDGCHLGHQKLIQDMLTLAEKHNQTPTILTFYPHPRDFFQKTGTQNCLFTVDMKKNFLKELGAKNVIVQTFDTDFSQKSARWFYDEFLCQQLNVKSLIIGPNFHFGHQREGSVAWLKKQTSGPEVHVLAPQTDGPHFISSSRIRQHLRSGESEHARELLGRDYMIEGHLVPGDRIGRTLGIPTINLGHIQQLIPKHGVYVGSVWLQDHNATSQTPPMRQGNEAIPAVINIGVRPTVDGVEERVEAHLLTGTWPEDMYELKAGFYLHQYLRDERKFPDLTALQKGIKQDILKAHQFFKR